MDVVEGEFAGAAELAQEDDGVPRLSWDIDLFGQFLPGTRTEKYAQKGTSNDMAVLVVESHCSGRDLRSGQAPLGVFVFHPGRGSDGGHLPSVGRKALHDVSHAARGLVPDGDVMSTFGRVVSGLPCRLPLIEPAGRVCVSDRRLLEVAIDHDGAVLRVLGLAFLIGPPGHGDEERRLQLVGYQFAVLFPHQVERLMVRVAHWNDHQAAFAQLVGQGLGNFLRRTGDNDLVKRRVLRPALESVADADEDVAVAQASQRPFGSPAQGFDDLDRIHLLDQRAEHRRLIAATGTDLQHAIRWLRVHLLGHVRNDGRRGHRLAFADRQAHVEIGQRLLVGRHELMPGRGPHRLQHIGILHSLGNDHRVDQLASPLSELRRRLSSGRFPNGDGKETCYRDPQVSGQDGGMEVGTPVVS